MSRPPGTPDLDLTTLGSSGLVNGAVFQTIDLQPAGSGVFNPFVQLQNSPTEQGYNTDAPPQFNEKSTAAFNHSLLLAAVPIVTGDGSNGTTEGVAYRMFTLDLNDPNNSPYVSLDRLQVWQEEAGNLTGFTSGSGFLTGTHTNYLAYNLDAGADHWVALNEQSHGSGQADVVVLIPDANFINDPAHRYVTLYSQFGAQSGWSSDGGFEEWATNGGPNSGPLSAMVVRKTAVVPGGTADTLGEDIAYTITVGNVGNTALTGITISDTQIPALTLGETLSAPTESGTANNVLDVGETWTYTLHHKVTQADLDSNGGGTGFISNSVTVDTAQTNPVSASASVVVVQSPPVLQMTKTPSVLSVGTAGAVITYTITVKNIGGITLTDLVVTDPQLTHSTPILDFNFPILSTTLGVNAQILVGDYNAGDTNQNGFQDPGETFQYANAGDFNQNGIIEPDQGESFIYANVGDTNQNGVEDTGEHFQYYNAGDTNHNGVADGSETFQFNVDHIVPFVSGDTNSDGNLNVGETWSYTVSYTVT